MCGCGRYRLHPACACRRLCNAADRLGRVIERAAQRGRYRHERAGHRQPGGIIRVQSAVADRRRKSAVWIDHHTGIAFQGQHTRYADQCRHADRWQRIQSIDIQLGRFPFRGRHPERSRDRWSEGLLEHFDYDTTRTSELTNFGLSDRPFRHTRIPACARCIV